MFTSTLTVLDHDMKGRRALDAYGMLRCGKDRGGVLIRTSRALQIS